MIAFNQSALRGRDGTKQDMKLTIDPEVWDMVSEIVETGAGKYGSSFVSFAIKVAVFLFSDDTSITDKLFPEIVDTLEEFIQREESDGESLVELSQRAESLASVMAWIAGDSRDYTEYILAAIMNDGTSSTLAKQADRILRGNK